MFIDLKADLALENSLKSPILIVLNSIEARPEASATKTGDACEESRGVGSSG